MKNAVVVAGQGAMCSLGIDVASTLQALRVGTSGLTFEDVYG